MPADQLDSYIIQSLAETDQISRYSLLYVKSSSCRFTSSWPKSGQFILQGICRDEELKVGLIDRYSLFVLESHFFWMRREWQVEGG